MELDPVRRELVKNALITIADNMIVTVVRTSRSTVVKNNLDFSSAICDADGVMVAQGLALPVHLGALMPALRGCLDHFGDDIHPGDILANNDPYSGASHLNDIFMFKPVYDRAGARVAFMSLILHHTDMGGRVPGGNACDSSEIFQEGLRIPPSKIYERSAPNATLMRIIEHNVRVPVKVLGDVRAQVAALHLGAREMERLIGEYDTAELRAYMTGLVDYAERLTRVGIAALPDGSVEFDDWIDDDGVGSEPVKIHLTLTVKGDEMVLDYTGTSPQTTGALNPNYWFTASCSYAAIRTVLPADMPNNAGFYRPITVVAPEGSFVNPRFPAPVGARGQGGHRVRMVVMGALAKLLPGRMPACCGGSEFGIAIAGWGRDRAPFLVFDFHNMTGHGALPDRDGQDAGPWCLGNLANVPVEVMEAENPVRIDEYGFLPDTGGAGRFRGALGIARQYRLLAEEALLQVRSDRQRSRPWGLAGGGPGAGGACLLNPDSPREEVLPGKFMRRMTKGDAFCVRMAGSGGYGDPFARAPEAVREDVLDGKVTVGHAAEAYGVAIDPETLAVDAPATAKLRARRGGRNRPRRPRATVAVSPARG
ncbi:MAG: hydantoinase B/oxoprolinase family protein [Proteobacteria bacterium]|nr:hydantoinase B/oxoprolinase family protein [Pseudomonadota bacterium]